MRLYFLPCKDSLDYFFCEKAPACESRLGLLHLPAGRFSKRNPWFGYLELELPQALVLLCSYNLTNWAPMKECRTVFLTSSPFFLKCFFWQKKNVERKKVLIGSFFLLWKLHSHFLPSLCFYIKVLSKEPLLKGKAQYNWPPCTNLFRTAAFDIDIIYLFTKQPTLERRSTVLSLPLQLVFPGLE